ncbi:MAG: penicillin-binding protein 2 [bacterium]|nr:penicillin-binding protein 2 [bacterium]
MKWRTSLLITGIFIAYGALVSNLYNLQLTNSSYYSAKAESQDRSAGFLQAERGDIYFVDKNDNLIPAAINKDYPNIYAVPEEIVDLATTSLMLSEILELDEEEIRNKLNKPGDLYELLVAKASAEQVDRVVAADIDGIYLDRQEFRFYPFNELAAHVIGFVSPNENDNSINGRYGVELYFDTELRGKLGKLDDSGNRGDALAPTDGKDIVLTIDRNIQARAEEVLGRLIEKYSAVSGTVIVQDPKTGRILALGNYPTFNPNEYSEYPIKNFLNPAVQAIYEPGSIFKVITMASGLDSGRLTPDDKYYDNGSVTLNSRTIRNWDLKGHGWVTMTEIIEQSINTGAVFAQQKVGRDIFYDYLVKFGFGGPTAINLPGELTGSLANLEGNTRDINFATASFGQGVSVTPIGLISAISTIANDGVLMRPLIRRDELPTPANRVLSAAAADQVTAMMASAVRKAQVAQIPNYEIAGKTGTAQVPNFGKGGYTDDVIDTYAGFAPATNPRFVILIKIDKPYGAPHAALTVVPAFRELAEFLLNYYNIGPDSLER